MLAVYKEQLLDGSTLEGACRSVGVFQPFLKEFSGQYQNWVAKLSRIGIKAIIPPFSSGSVARNE